MNGSVNAVVQKGDTIYIGGAFTQVGRQDSVGANGGTVDFNTGKHFSHWPKPNNAVSMVIGDGSGGFYIAGAFTMVGTHARNGVAHINASGVLTSQLAGLTFNSTVYALAFSGNTLYIGGAFTSVGDNSSTNITRNRLAAVNVLTSQFTSWDPNVNDNISTLAVKNDSIYLGGTFTQVGGLLRTRLAKVSLSTGIPAAWDPAVDAEVMVLALYGDTLYAGGKFTSVSGEVRNRIAAFKDTALLAWNPDASDQVRAIAIQNNTVYLSGIFTTIGGLPRVALASVDRLSGAVNLWNPASAATVVNSMVLRNNIMYASGNFINKSVGGLVRTSIVALDLNLDTLMALPWNPNVPEGAVNTIAVSGNTNMLYMGGIFARLGSVTRNRLAAFRSSTGELLAWNPNADNTILLLAISKKLNRYWPSAKS